MNKKITIRIVLVLAMSIALMAPLRAQAATYADLETRVKQAFGLCMLDPTSYAIMCDYSRSLKSLQDQIKDAPAADQPGYIDEWDDGGITYAKASPEIANTFFFAVGAGKLDNSGKVITGGAPSSAVDNCGGVDVSINVDCDGTGNPIYDYLRNIVVILGGFIGLGVVVAIIVAGIQYASSAGEPAKIAKAKERIFNAVLGLILYIMLAAILRYLLPNVFAS